MKIHEIMEAISNRPRSMHYWKMRLRDLQSIQDAATHAVSLFQNIDTSSELNYALSDAGFNLHPDDLKSLASRLTGAMSGLSPENLIGAIESFLRYADDPKHNFYQYIPPALGHIQDSLTHWEDTITQLPTYEQVEQTITNPDVDLLNPEYFNPQEIASTKQFLEATRVFLPAIHRYVAVIQNLATKVQAQNDHRAMMNNHVFNGEPTWPQHAEVEKVYHATAYASEIAQQGFSAEKPSGYKGVGNYGEQKSISVTHDLKNAQDIMRCLKEITMIANGQLKAPTIAAWIRRENIANFPWKEFMHVRGGQNEFGMPLYVPTTLDKLDINNTVDLYNKYIWLSKIHPNPVFANMTELVQSLVGRPQKDIGILELQIRPDPKTQTYHPAEAEFRVPPSAIISMKRVM
jgi:hypothetical protein